MPPPNEIEERANELRDMYIEALHSQTGTDFVWDKLASHVMIREIEARLAELEMSYERPQEYDERLEALNKKIKELREQC